MLHEPPEATDWTLSDIAVEFAESIGLGLDEWQQWLVRWTFARRPDNLWAARDVAAEVPRQNGKNIWLEAVELAGLFLFGDRLITHSAHRADVSHEHFLSLKAHIEACDDLMDAMPTARPNNGFITTNGNECIELESGARLLFKARAHASGRGPRPQKIIFDEALVLAKGQVGSMAPSISAQRNPQIIFASSAPMASSEVLHALRHRAIEPEAGDRLFFAAWNNPAGIDPHDRDGWYRVNPSLGYERMTETSLMANRKLMDDAEFMREHLGVPEEPEGDARSAKIPAAEWAASANDRRPLLEPGCVTVAFDVALDGSHSSIAIGGGSLAAPYVELIQHQAGVGWLPAMLVQLADIWKPEVVGCNGAGPSQAQVGAISLALTEAGSDVPVRQLSAVEWKAACGGLYVDVVEGRLCRPRVDQGPLDVAAGDAAERVLGDGFAWHVRNATVPLSPLGAVTAARALLPQVSNYDVLESVG